MPTPLSPSTLLQWWPHPELPLDPSPFFQSSLPALGPLPMGPENLTPGAVRPPYGEESTSSSLAMVVILWGPEPQDSTQQRLKVIC